MACIQVREGQGLVIVYQLDECGAPETGAGNKLVLSNISELSYEEQIAEGDEVIERTFSGTKCYTDVGQDELQRVNVSVTSCGINTTLDTFLMGSTALSTSGFGRVDLTDGNSNVAIEVLLKLDAAACGGSGTSPVAGWFFPLVKNWSPSGGTTLNGTDLVKPAYSGKGFKNPNVFNGTPFDLRRWRTAAGFTPGATATDPAGQWYGFYVFDDFTVASGGVSWDSLYASASCDALTFAASS